MVDFQFFAAHNQIACAATTAMRNLFLIAPALLSLLFVQIVFGQQQQTTVKQVGKNCEWKEQTVVQPNGDYKYEWQFVCGFGGKSGVGSSAGSEIDSTEAPLPETKETLVASGIRKYAGLGQYANAVKDFERAVELDPNYGEAILQRAVARVWLRQYDAAKTDFRRAAELEPNNARVYFERAKLYRELKDFKSAVADLNLALDLSPQSNSFYAALRELRVELRQTDELIRDFSRVVAANPTAVEPLRARRELYRELNQPDKAVADANKIIELLPRSIEDRKKRSELHRAFKQNEAADKDETVIGEMLLADQNKPFDPYNAYYQNPNLLFASAVRYFDAGQYEKAIPALTSVIQITPQQARAFYYRGAAYSRFKQYEQAFADLSKAIELDPKLAAAYSARAAALRALNRIEAALRDEARHRELTATPPQLLQSQSQQLRLQQLQSDLRERVSSLRSAASVNKAGVFPDLLYKGAQLNMLGEALTEAKRTRASLRPSPAPHGFDYAAEPLSDLSSRSSDCYSRRPVSEIDSRNFI